MKRIVLQYVLAIWLALMAIPAHAFSLLDPQTWPANLNPHNWPFTLIPIPEVATNPNGGVTYGVLLAFLFQNQKNDIQNIFPPDITNHTDLCARRTGRYFFYPPAGTHWYSINRGPGNNAPPVAPYF